MIDDQSVKDILLEKHPPAQPLHPSTIVTIVTTPNVFHSVLFDSISPELIRSIMLKLMVLLVCQVLTLLLGKNCIPHSSPLKLTYALLWLH